MFLEAEKAKKAFVIGIISDIILIIIFFCYPCFLKIKRWFIMAILLKLCFV